MSSSNNDTSVKVAVRIRPLNSDEVAEDSFHCIGVVPGESQIIAGSDSTFTFDYVFGVDTAQSNIYDDCVTDLVNAAFEGFNATILAYGQTGSGKTYTMGSSAEVLLSSESIGIIPRVIHSLFETVHKREEEDLNCSYKIYVQFLEIYGEDIKDLLDHTKTSKVTIRETVNGDVFISGAREEAVSSATQMMRALEEGSKHRTTGSTRMNQSSSRSHAIFTVVLEQTIRRGALPDNSGEGGDNGGEESPRRNTEDSTNNPGPPNISQSPQVEVRRSCFHFVDLAGSERAKRTGAAGQQLKEGIDINKGLLALGNVISALGDEQKRGKVHVPYRDSKLTRILQDSLGGNSKTLFICCVSPASVNYHESLTALRYANRARNIKNKPVVNRDPTLLMIDELKSLVQNLSVELLSARRAGHRPLSDCTITDDQLLSFTLASFNPSSLTTGTSTTTSTSTSVAGSTGKSQNTGQKSVTSTTTTRNEAFSVMSSNNSSYMVSSAHTAISTTSTTHSLPTASLKVEISSLKSKLTDADLEVKRLTDQLKFAKMQSSELSDRIILIESERDFFQMKWGSVCPEELDSLRSQVGEETNQNNDKKQTMDVIGKYLREIETLKKENAELQQYKNAAATGGAIDFVDVDDTIENELSSSVARVIAQTQEHLRQETMRLRGVEEGTVLFGDAALGDEIGDSELYGEEGASDKNYELAEKRADAEERAFQLRQSLLVAEVHDLGESIQLKEQLVQQLQRSQYQYSVMKAFYEQKLHALEEEMSAKQAEREALMAELQEVVSQVEVAGKKNTKEGNLREELKKKDEELKLLKKRQDDLNNLSQVQSRYLKQVSKLESDIDSMKKQRVDLSKTLQADKKRHLVALNDKTREIEKLKRELTKSAGEVKKLARDKERAEDKAREAMREGSALRKRANEMLKFVGVDSGSAAASSRIAGRKPSITKPVSAPTSSSTVSSSRFLSEELMKTKRWLDKNISELNARDKTSESLRKQCEQQLALMQEKESLESQLQACSRKYSLDSLEYQSAVSDLEEQLENLGDEVKLRSAKIRGTQKILSSLDEKLGDDKTIELLKRTAASSLPSAHELIRLLFEMLVSARRTVSVKDEMIENFEKKEQSLKNEIEKLCAKLASTERLHDLDLTKAMNDYEEKLQGLFSHSSVGQVVLAESKMGVPLTPTRDKKLERTSTCSALSANQTSSSDDNNRFSVGSVDSYRMLLAVSTEQCNNLRAQLAKEEQHSREQDNRLSEIEAIRLQLQRELDEKNTVVAFLEDERQLFREMADDMKAALVAMGGSQGAAVIKQVREKATERGNDLRAPRTYKAPVFFDDEGLSDDDDSESVMMEFNNLAEEINRTGGIAFSNDPSSSGKGVVYDRLTNPSNFTGSMKKVFEHDLASKRQKVQKIKKQENDKVIKKEKSGTNAERTNEATGKRTDATDLLLDVSNFPNSDNPSSLGSARAHSSGKVPSNIESDDYTGQDGTNVDPSSNVFTRLSKNYTGIHKYMHSQEGCNVSPLYSTGNSSGLASNPTAESQGHADPSNTEYAFLGGDEEESPRLTEDKVSVKTRSASTSVSITDRLYASSTQSARLKQNNMVQSTNPPPPPKNNSKPLAASNFLDSGPVVSPRPPLLHTNSSQKLVNVESSNEKGLTDRGAVSYISVDKTDKPSRTEQLASLGKLLINVSEDIHASSSRKKLSSPHANAGSSLSSSL